MWQDKKAEESFKELALLIKNYDKEDPYYQKKKLGKLTKHKRLISLSKQPVLQTVDERDEDRCEEDSQFDQSICKKPSQLIDSPLPSNDEDDYQEDEDHNEACESDSPSDEAESLILKL